MLLTTWLYRSNNLEHQWAFQLPLSMRADFIWLDNRREKGPQMKHDLILPIVVLALILSTCIVLASTFHFDAGTWWAR